MRWEYVYGANTAEEILLSAKRRIFKIIIAGHCSPKTEKALKVAREKKIPIVVRSSKYLDKISRGGNHQGIMLEVEEISSINLCQALESAKGKNEIWVAIDSVTDPMNLGSIIRSCACFGVRNVVIPQRRTAPVTPAMQKSASGALEKVNIIKVVNLNQTIIALKKKGFWIYGADGKGEDIRKVDFAFPALIIMGSEGEGIHLKTKEHCDKLVSLPQKGGVESLNAAVAAGIFMYEVSRRI